VIREYNKKHTSGLFGTVTDSQVEFKLYNMYFCSIHKVKLDEERSDDLVLHSTITNHLMFVAPLIAAPYICF